MASGGDPPKMDLSSAAATTVSMGLRFGGDGRQVAGVRQPKNLLSTVVSGMGVAPVRIMSIQKHWWEAFPGLRQFHREQLACQHVHAYAQYLARAQLVVQRRGVLQIQFELLIKWHHRTWACLAI